MGPCQNVYECSQKGQKLYYRLVSINIDSQKWKGVNLLHNAEDSACNWLHAIGWRLVTTNTCIIEVKFLSYL